MLAVQVQEAETSQAVVAAVGHFLLVGMEPAQALAETVAMG
jgi:hypothetical protein